jgi:pilus assembly protein Flp/PilA
MKNICLKLFVKAQVFWAEMKDERGQDLVEYALVVALVALAATTGMKTLATGINAAFISITSSLNNAI